MTHRLSAVARGAILLIMAACLPTGALSQVAIQSADFLKIFAPGEFHFSTEGVGGTFDIGNTGGPNVYDFTSLGLPNLFVSYNFEAGTLPTLAARYPGDAITIGDSPTTIEKNPVFLIKPDTVFSIGQASLVPTQRYVHYRPYDIIAVFPTVYGTTFSQTVSRYDTTFGTEGQVISATHSESVEVTTIDGYGLLKTSAGDFECIRVRKDHTAYGDKEFIYMTREGLAVLVGGVPLTDPNSGYVTGGAQILMAPSVLGVDPAGPLPLTFALEQNYPNPFNPATVISFTLPTSSFTTLKVFTLLGQEIATLVHGQKDAGTHSVRFDAGSLSSGLYIYRLQAGDLVQARSMLYMK